MTRRLLPAALAVATLAVFGFAGPAGASLAPAVSTAQSALNGVTNDSCFECHGVRGKTPSITVGGEQKSTFVNRAMYDASRHGKLGCTSCHLGFKPGIHDAGQTAGWLMTAKLTACGECHADQFAMYRSSFHGNLVFGHSNGKAPVCADCHAPHDILTPGTVAFRQSERVLCARCHAQAEKTYLDSYHGKAFYLGRLNAAVCPDCHGGHKILSPSNPASTVSYQNIVGTCSKCHPGANRNFAGFLVHVDPSSPRSSIWVWSFNLLYLILISVVFTFGFVHSGLYIYRGFKDGLYSRRHTG